jgi:hypothetical protein
MIDHPSGLPAEPETDSKPTFTKEDLELLQSDMDAAEAEHDLAEEDSRAIAEMRRLGVDDEAIARHRGLTVEQIAPKPKVTIASVEAELEDLRKLRTSNRRQYWSKEVQAREGELYAQLDELKAGRSEAAEDREDRSPQSKESDPAGGLPEALVERWEATPGGINEALAALRTRVAVLSALDVEEADDLRVSFDGLSEAEQTEIADALSQDGGKWPAANEQQIAELAETEHGPELLKTWGNAAPARLGAALSEYRFIESRLTETSKLRVHRWAQSRSAAQKRAIIDILARRAARRTIVRSAGSTRGGPLPL